MKAAQQDALLSFFKVVAQQERLKIIGCLVEGPASVTELADALETRESGLTRHLNQLKEFGFIHQERSGSEVLLSLQFSGLERYRELILENSFSDDSEELIRNRYIKKQRLQSLPTDTGERKVILRWLAETFEVGRRYSQAAVNDVLSRHAPHQAVLHHALIESGLLANTGGIYWRPEED